MTAKPTATVGSGRSRQAAGHGFWSQARPDLETHTKGTDDVPFLCHHDHKGCQTAAREFVKPRQSRSQLEVRPNLHTPCDFC